MCCRDWSGIRTNAVSVESILLTAGIALALKLDFGWMKLYLQGTAARRVVT